jgi:hypothetical protein
MARWQYFDAPRDVSADPPRHVKADTMLLLTDGSVLVHDANDKPHATGTGTRWRDWYRLTPDAAGRYRTGRWSGRLPMATGRLYFASGVLADGRVYAVGGEYADGFKEEDKCASGEIFDPQSNEWYPMDKPRRYHFIAGDCSSMVLADGRVLFAGNPRGSRTAIWNPVTGRWREAGRGHPAGAQTKVGVNNEETWTLLRSGNVLTVQITGATATRNAEQYVPSIDKWVSAGHTTHNLVVGKIVDYVSHEIGPAILLPSGKVIAIGGTGRTEIYTPDRDPARPGTWSAGPHMPADPDNPLSPAGFLTALDAPAVLLPSGKVICTGGATRKETDKKGNVSYWSGPTQFLVYDPASRARTLQRLANQPRNRNGDTWQASLLLLPNGHVLYSAQQNTLGEYTPDPADLTARPSWRPRIATCPASLARDDTATITGARFNGISQANSYGDDRQSATNFPLVRLTQGTGTATYLRTFGFSSMGVATGNTTVTTQVEVPADLPAGRWDLAVIANGIASPTTQVEVV